MRQNKKDNDTQNITQAEAPDKQLKNSKRRLSAAKRRQIQEQKYKRSLEYKLFTIAKEQKFKKWYKLDNSALLYPMTTTDGNELFRVSALLKNEVEPETLQYALNDVFSRFPTMTGCLKNGFFWPYIDKPQTPLVVLQENDLPCKPLPMNGRSSQMRVLYFKNMIACEFFHSATDGTGAIVFLNTLLVSYFRRLGHDIVDMTNSLDHRDKPNHEEMKDLIEHITVKQNAPKLPKVIKARPMVGTSLPYGTYITRHAYCDAKQIRAAAKELGVSVTELIGAAQLLAMNSHFMHIGTKSNLPIRILVAVNLRKIYNLDTLRNFANYVFYQYNGQATLAEVAHDVHEQQQQQLTVDRFNAMVSYNYNSSNHPLLKIVPLWVKRIAVKSVVSTMGEGFVNCTTLSNLGLIQAPKEFEHLVARYDFQFAKGSKKIPMIGVATYNNVCAIAITSSLVETVFERTFTSLLNELGVNFAIESDIVEGLE